MSQAQIERRLRTLSKQLRSARDALAVTVECAGERMEALYTHLGFEKHAQAAVDDPTNQTKKLAMVSMVRLPRSAAPAAQSTHSTPSSAPGRVSKRA